MTQIFINFYTDKIAHFDIQLHSISRYLIVNEFNNHKLQYLRSASALLMAFRILVLLTYIIYVCCIPREAKIFKPAKQSQGQGAEVVRIIGNKYLNRLDPYLMLDYFHVKLPGGFPDHPHRGFQTITYLKSGVIHHEDFKSHKGTIKAGDVQWMTAGKGIVHAEMPGSFEEPSIGFQLWLNLKAQSKMKEPHYQEFRSSQIATYSDQAATVKVICGKINGVTGPVKHQTPTYFLDVNLRPNGYFQITTNKQWNSLIFVYDGQVSYQGTQRNYEVKNLTACVLQKSYTQQSKHVFKSINSSHFLFLSGQPLNEQVASYGPFVMNSESQLKKAFSDYRKGQNGFEGARSWVSKIKDLKDRNNNDL